MRNSISFFLDSDRSEAAINYTKIYFLRKRFFSISKNVLIYSCHTVDAASPPDSNLFEKIF